HPHDPERALERQGDVPVTDPADPPPLGVLQPDRNSRGAPHFWSPSLLAGVPGSRPLGTPASSLRSFVAAVAAPRTTNATGTSAPRLRSWPVPCEPPAGGTGDATTCSSA